MRLGRALEADSLLIRIGLNSSLKDACLEILSDLVFLVEHAMCELNHLLLDECNLSVVLEHVDQRLAADRCRETLARKLDAHMRCQLVYSVELALREEFSVKLRRSLR